MEIVFNFRIPSNDFFCRSYKVTLAGIQVTVERLSPFVLTYILTLKLTLAGIDLPGYVGHIKCLQHTSPQQAQEPPRHHPDQH